MTRPKLLPVAVGQSGVLLVNLLVVMAALLIIGTTVASHAATQYAAAKRNVFTANALFVAEAGIEESLKQLNQDDDFPGFTAEQEFFDDEEQGRGVYTTTVADMPTTDAKTITSWGEVYKTGETETPVDRHGVRVTVVGTGSDGYSVHSGPGGLILSGSAGITNSDVFANGFIQMTGAARIGTSAVPAKVDVANLRCPTGSNPGATYPAVCGSGNQPISLQWSTFIYGTVCATHQTGTGPNPSGNILPGIGGLGLVPGCTAPPASMPAYDRAAHIARVAVTGSGNDNAYVCNSWPFQRNWPANLRLNGNTNVGGSCEVTINGDVYITGNLTLGGASRITIANSLGTNRPNIIVDGNIDVGGSAAIIANSSGTGAHFISFRSNAPCNPNCTALSGTQLYNSQSLQTVSIGGAVNLPGMIFGAYWGRINIGGSGNIGAAYGQTVDMSGAGTVTFGTELSSGASTWTITSYQQLYED